MISLRQHIIELLIQKGILTSAQVEEILHLAAKEGGRLVSLLTGENFIKKEFLIEFINSNLNLPTIDTSQLKITPELLNLIPAGIARRYHILPLSQDGQNITLGLNNPLTIFDLDEIDNLKGYAVNPVIAPEAELTKLIDQYYPLFSLPGTKAQNMESIISGVAELPIQREEEIELSKLVHLTEEVPVIKATNFILDKAIELKASDILIEPLEHSTRIRFRIDGIFQQIESLPKSIHPFIISRIKVISNLDIAEHRLPQDGQFRMKSRDREVDFRVSAFPLITGEKIAIRILDKSLGLLDIDKLGLKEEASDKLKKAAILPYGMILVCGPTGSGKTSTLYSILKYIHSPEKNIVTVEDPVEYQLRGVNQVAVNTKLGLIFSRCLRSILRQDPDVIMIGEIRDFETVDIAIKAALTGHLVLSTLHTTTSAGSIIRLIDMGVEPFLINASLIAIVAQRLARRICLHCKEEIPGQPYFRGRGCDECFKSGYSGRLLISEILYMSSKIKEAVISERLDESKIKELSRAEGMKTLREEGEYLARAGITTLEEVLRVTPAD